MYKSCTKKEGNVSENDLCSLGCYAKQSLGGRGRVRSHMWFSACEICTFVAIS